MKLKHDPGWELQADGSHMRLDIYDVIGDGMFGGVSAKDVRDAIDKHENVTDIDVHLNSPGGSAFDGITIYNVLAQHEANVTVNVDGIAASAASVVAMAGDEIRMAENAMMMIHNASGLTIGTAEDHRQMAQTLDKIDKQIVTTYASRTGNDAESVSEKMSAETWMTATEAVDEGFADTVVEAKKAAALWPGHELLNHFRNVPHELREGIQSHQRKDDDMATTKAPEMTAEQFAELNPDAIEQWRNEGREEAKEKFAEQLNEAKATAFDEGAKNERERCEALAKVFSQNPKFLAEQMHKGHDVPKAKAEAFDAGIGQDEGTDPVALDPKADATDDKDTSDLPLNQRIEKEWEDNADKCQDKFKNFYAYAAYRQSKERRKKSA